MGLMDDLIQEDSVWFVDADTMPGVEAITYTPKGGAPVTINALVFRKGRNENEVMQGTSYEQIEVEIRNHATTGVTSINTGGDTISIAKQQGGAAETRAVVRVIDSDAGMWRLLIQ